MRFEISERIRTSKTQGELLEVLEMQFKKVSKKVKLIDQAIQIKSIQATFGSINRADTTLISIKKMDDGWLIIADVHYRPSFAFWIIFIALIFTWVLWILPIFFYLNQKKFVKTAISECLNRVKNEFDQLGTNKTYSHADEIERLATLKEKGIISELEFTETKRQIIGS